MIDTHAHVYVDDFQGDLADTIRRAKDAGVEHICLPNIDFESIDALKKLVDQHPAYFHPMMGLHPCSVKADYKTVLENIKSELYSGHYCGVGEIGLDYYWDQSTKAIQQEALQTQIQWAKDLELPIALHVRDAMPDMLEIIESLNEPNLTGVFHCFSTDLADAERILSFGGFYLGIGGVATFKNGGLDQVIPHIDLDYLVLETDSPYLAPVPHRGKRNEPSYLSLVVDRIASMKQITPEEVISVTTANALRLFSLRT